MLPPPLMLTIKNQADSGTTSGGQKPEHRFNPCNPCNLFNPCNSHPLPLALVLSCVLLFTGCTPDGPRALLAGKRLIEQGKYPQAIEKLRTATSLLMTNAHAWNYLGLACHHAGETAEAEKAYQRALALDHDLTEAHYNLGCLWLAQNKPDAARTELMAFTLRRANSAEGLLQLGAAQLRSAELEPTVQARSRELVAAEKSFADALRLNPKSAEGLNGMGLVRLQRGRASEAAHLFNTAVTLQPGYRPAQTGGLDQFVQARDRRHSAETCPRDQSPQIRARPFASNGSCKLAG